MGKARWIAAAAAGTAAVAAAAYYLHDRNAEKPEYDLLIDEGQFALRDYPPASVAVTVRQGGRESAFGKAFKALSDYFLGRSRKGAKISMTAPVLLLPAEGGGWLTRFYVPSKWKREELPSPPAGIDLGELPQRKVAAIRFSGTADDDDLESREAELREWMAANELEPAGPVEYAFYNSPFIPGPVRRNEVLIPVA